MAVQTTSVENMLRRIGRTPLIPLNNVKTKGMKLYAKLEWYNPFGSLKDRPAYWMIKEAERKGVIRKGEHIIIEPTSGNTGIALSGICSALGYDVEVVIPCRASEKTKSILKSLKINVLETDDDLCPRVGPGTDQSIALAKSIVEGKPTKYFMPNQYENEANFLSHFETTGPEIWKDTNGEITHFITGVGTGGTITGTSTFLKEKNKDLKVIAVQPQKGHHLQGLRNVDESKMPELLKKRLEVIDKWLTISDNEAFDSVSKASIYENLFIGPSSGATLSAALEIADNVKEGVGVVVFGDSGEKYWSVFEEFNVFNKEDFNRLKISSKYLSKPLFPMIE